MVPQIELLFSLKSMWIERTTFTTVYKLPGILRWFEATDMKHVRMNRCPTPPNIWLMIVFVFLVCLLIPQKPTYSHYAVILVSFMSSIPPCLDHFIFRRPCPHWRMPLKPWTSPMRRFWSWSTSTRQTVAFPSTLSPCCSMASWTRQSWVALPNMKRYCWGKAIYCMRKHIQTSSDWRMHDVTTR